MFTSLELALLILVLLFFTFTVVSIRQVHILARELRETQRESPKQSKESETKN